MGFCKIDDKPCDGASLVCRLNPTALEPMYYDGVDGTKRKFYNRRCFNYTERDTFKHCIVCGARIRAKTDNKSGLCRVCWGKRLGLRSGKKKVEK